MGYEKSVKHWVFKNVLQDIQKHTQAVWSDPVLLMENEFNLDYVSSCPVQEMKFRQPKKSIYFGKEEQFQVSALNYNSFHWSPLW